MRKKVVVTYVTDEGCEIDYSNPTARGFIEVPEASQGFNTMLLKTSVDFLSNNNRALRERIQSLELELQQAETRYKELSNELATVNRIRVNCEEKLRKIDDIISPF